MMDFENFVKCPPDFSKLEVIQRVTTTCPNCGRQIQFIAQPQLRDKRKVEEYYQKTICSIEERYRELRQQVTHLNLCLNIAEQLLKKHNLL